MTENIVVATQKDLDKALQEHPTAQLILIGDGAFHVGRSAHVEARESVHVEAWGSARVEAWENAHVEAWGSARVEAWENARVEAWENAHVEAWGSAHVVARGSAHVEARESAHVVARGSAHVVARGSAHVEARESAHVEARESAHVEAWENAHVVARGSAHVVARESAHVVAWENAHVVAWESAHVEAWESAHVVARGSAHVEARGSAHVVAGGSAHVVARESAHVVATQYVAIHQHNDQVQVVGGILIKVPKPTMPLEWCAFYGATIEGELAILYKAVRDDYRSAHGIVYAPGTTPQAPDWDGGKEECGGGLHFTADPLSGLSFDKEATRFVACPVALADIVVHPNPDYPYKIKAPRVAAPIYEVTRDGKRMTGNGKGI